MTQEEKAKAYDEALERARKIHNEILNNEILGFPDQIREIFPELRESEDERIRKALYKMAKVPRKEIYEAEGITKEQAFAWLEKQKERGPLTKEEEYILHRIIEYLEDETCPSEWISLLHDIYCLPYEKQKEEEGYEAIPVESTLEYKLGFKAGKESEKQKERPTNEEMLRTLRAEYEKGVADTIAKCEQKEQKPLSTEETELNSLAFLEQMGYTCIPPKKEHQNNSDAPKNALGGALNSPLDKDKNLDDIAQDYVEAVKDYNPEPNWDLMQTAVCYGYHYREQEEHSMSAEEEWSEEDEKIVNNIVSVLGQYIDYKSVSGTGSGYATPRYSKEIDWLKSLHPQWRPSKEQMDSLRDTIVQTKGYSYSMYLPELYEQLKGIY